MRALKQRAAIIGTLVASLYAVGMLEGAAEAQKARYTRDTKIAVKVQQTERTKKQEPKKGPKQEALPEITADDVIEIQGKVQNIQDQQIVLLEQLIDDTPDDEASEKADLLFRLAELHAQKQRYFRFRGMEMYPKINKTPKNKQGSLKSQQKQYFESSKKSLLDAVKVYKRIADNPKFKNYQRMDESLFYYAYTLQGAKYMKEARTIYHRLIKDYPNSKYIPDAYLSFADYYFQENSLANAEQFYDKVLQFPKSRVYTYALYKKGWVFLNLDRAQDALEVFYKVVTLTKNDKSKATLNRAAKKDFVRAYAEVGKAQLALKAFERVDKDYAFEMLQILADIYSEKGMSEKAIFTFRELIGTKPKHKMVCEWQYNIVSGMMSVGNNNQKVDEIENMVKLYTAIKDKKILESDALTECRENAEGVTSEMAKLWHNEAMKTLNIETLAYVDRLYKLFLDNFPDSPEYGEMQYYQAELLWQRAENEKNQRLATELWERAALAFTDVVKSGKVEGKALKESAYAAVLGWKNALAVDPRTKEPPPPTDTKDQKVPDPIEIPEREQKMLAAFDVYIDYIKDPKDQELVEMKFLKARIYWRYNHFEEAAPLFVDIIDKHRSHETAEWSVNLLLDSLNRLQRYDQMIVLVDKLIEDKKFLEDKEDLGARLELLKRQSLRKNAEKLESDAKSSGDFGKYVACGKAYIDIFNRDPGGEGSDEVLYNAGVCFEQGKSIGAAITMFELLSKQFPKSNNTQKAIARLGNAYGKIAWYREASEKLEEYARRFGGEKDAYDALSDAVFYRKGIGDDDQAVKDSEAFIKAYGKKKIPEAANAMFSMTSIYEKQGDKDTIVKHLRRYLKTYGAKGGVDRQIIAHVKIGQILWDQSCPVKTIDGACVKITRERSIVDKRKKGKKKRASLPTQCGPESKIKLQVVSRDARKVKDSQGEFKKAISLFGNGSAMGKVPGEAGEKEARAALMVRYYANAKFAMNEEDYENFLNQKFPQKLDFDPKKPAVAKKSLKRFMDWFANKEKLGGETAKKYKEIVDITGGGAHYAIAAAARIGQISQNFSDALFTAEIPNDVRTGSYAEDKVDAYCDELTTRAEPLENLSLGAFNFCLETSTKLNWFNEWSKLCERELGQIRPQDFPTASELRASSNNYAAITDIEPPVLTLE